MEILIKVEDLARSLFREFLIKNSLTKTLEVFNDEDKRYRPKITKIDLIKYLAIEKLIKMNKEKQHPQNTLLEIIVDYLHGKYKQMMEKLEIQNNNNKLDSIGTSQKNLYSEKKESEISHPSNKSLTDVYKNNESESQKIETQKTEIEKKEKKLEKKVQNLDKLNDFLENASISNNTKHEDPFKKSQDVESNSDFFQTSQEKPQESLKQEKTLPEIPTKSLKKPGKLIKIDKTSIETQEKKDENPQTELFSYEKKPIQQKAKDPIEIQQKIKDPFEAKKPKVEQKASEVKKPKVEETKINDQKHITDELDDFDEVFNFGVKPMEPVRITTKPEKTIKKAEEQIKDKSSEKNSKLSEVRMNLLNPFELPSNINKPEFDYLMKAKLGMKAQKSRNLMSLDKETRDGLRKLLFGEGEMKNLPKSWQQGFYFTESPGLFFGLMQKEGGPCGVLACVQAYLIKHLLFFANAINKSDKNLLNLLRTNCVLLGLSEILWKCTSKHYKKVTLIVSESNSLSLESCGMVSYEPQDLNELYMILQNHKDDFLGQYNSGVALFLYSIIVTKGIENFRSEMDISETNVIGLHSTCTQEVVNLMLTGEASSNCIDGVKEVDSNYKIRGVKARSDFGFLTILEFYNYTKVEQNLKEPFFPIWVMSTEYHYCVCFSNEFRTLDQNAKNFEVVYYDGLNHPNDFIVVEVGDRKERVTKGKEENLPLLDMVLITKWGKDREIIWKGYEPIF